MKYYFAPLEGVTSAPYRQAHHRHFSGVDRYYAPFISPTIHHVLTPREQRDILPEYNEGVPVIPQLLTKNAEDFLWAAGDLAAMGYSEVNLNLGCPSGTVVSKGKGSGFLGHPEELERFLDEIFEKSPIAVSVKTRLGVTDPDEFGPILELYNRYPISELTIHPRVQKQMYRKEVSVAMQGSNPVMNKYCGGDAGRDPIYIVRLAEMYLISAECLGLEGGGLERLNELRRFRGLEDVTPSDEEAFLDAVLQERRLELFGEGFRWYDLVRTGRYTSVIGVDDKYSVLPIPARELSLNGNLRQHPLWSSKDSI